VRIRTRKLGFEDLNGADIHVELVDVMLTEVADTEAAMSVMDTSHWTQVSQQHLQQCRLTSPVTTDLDIITNCESNTVSREAPRYIWTIAHTQIVFIK